MKLEIQLRQAHKMEGIGTLASGIAHDFNNILAIMLGNADIALYSLPELHEARHQLESILKAGNRAKDLIKHILMFSRTSDYKLKPLKVNHIISEGLKMLRAAIPTTIEIKPDIDNNCAIINGDPTQIHQVLMNLATNAAHSMEDKGGSIEVTVKNTELTVENVMDVPDASPGSYVCLMVKDTGYGISPEIINRIFDPYFTTKDVHKGSGMGLAVVHGIIKNHAGFITVDSKPGKGASFFVYFPTNTEDATSEKEENLPVPTGVENILFIDDEKMMVTIGKKMLEMLGYTVTAIDDSIDAYETFCAHPDNFDLIITDQTMPNMTGVELAKKILSIRPDMPIILCSGYSSQIDEVKAQEIGIKAYVTKPLMKKDFATLVREVIDGAM
jgi:CheY-like chemotaxis protein